jgi:hypothetical protein
VPGDAVGQGLTNPSHTVTEHRGSEHAERRFFTSLAVAEMEIGWRPEHPRLLVCWAWSTAAKVRLSSVSSIREADPGELEFLSLDTRPGQR